MFLFCVGTLSFMRFGREDFDLTITYVIRLFDETVDFSDLYLLSNYHFSAVAMP